MAYVPPNSEVYVCTAVPLDNSYQHTILWDNPADQIAYFTTYPNPCVWKGTKYSYVRDGNNAIQENKIRIDCKISPIIEQANYLCYRNLSHDNVFYCAFITYMRYINENCVEIGFELDVMQTYFRYDNLHECIVERNILPKSEDTYHTHLFPEPVDLSEFTEDEGHYVTMSTDIWGSGMDIIIWSTTSSDGSPLSNYEGGIWSGMFTGLRPINFHLDAQNPASTIKAINDYLSAVNSIGLSESIITATAFPTSLIPSNFSASPNKAITKSYTIPGRDGSYESNGWNIKNNKCYNYPYMMLTICDGCGRYKNYNLNAFDYDATGQNVIKFDLLATIAPHPQIAIFPEYYKGNVNKNANSMHNVGWLNSFQAFRQGTPVNLEEGFFMTDLPTITLPLPSFLSQLAYNVGQVLIPNALKFAGLAMATGSMVGSALATASPSGVVSANVIDMNGNPLPPPQQPAQTTPSDQKLLAGYYAVTSTALNVFDQDRNQVRNYDTNSAMVGACINDFYFRFSSPRLRYLWAMDEYFTKYGYTVNKLEKPRIDNRSRWTYVKTKDCSYTGNAPVSVTTTIQGIFNNGITFWKQPAYVGNYSVNNA